MDNNRRQLYEDARRFAGMFRSFLIAADTLGKIDSIDQATQEAEQRLANARADEKAYLERAKGEGDRIKAEADAVLDRAKSEAAKKVSDAIHEADEIKATALREAAPMQAAVAAAKRELAQLNGQAEVLRTEIQKLTATQDERQRQCAEIERRLAELRAKFAE